MMNDVTLERKNGIQKGNSFTYHKNSGYIGIMYAMLAVSVVELVGVSLLLVRWNPILHWIHLILGILVIVFLVTDIRAVRKNPIMIEDGKLYLKIGIRPKVVIELENIQEMMSGKINYENDRKKKDVLDLTLLGLDDPSFEIVLSEPIDYKSKKSVRRIFITVDDKEGFSEMI